MSQQWTRLVNIHSGKVSKFPLDSLPPYSAASHVWSEALFAPGQLFLSSPGSKAIHALKSTRFRELEYCWIDTLCIDQDDENDKNSQIPLMGRIYGGAVVVVIVLTNKIGLQQDEINRAIGAVEPGVAFLKAWEVEKALSWGSPETTKHLLHALDLLTILGTAASKWTSRVWTSQEYILAKQTIWIGGDLIPITFDPIYIAYIQSLCEMIDTHSYLNSKYHAAHMLRGAATASTGTHDRTRVLEIMADRETTVAEDYIYGAMNATGVVLEDTSIKGVENVWALWWEKAISEGHVRWALLPPGIGPEAAARENCIMPSYQERGEASSCFGLVTSVPRPYGDVGVRRGTVEMVGRLVGECKIVCKLPRIPKIKGQFSPTFAVILWAAGDAELALRITSAAAGGRYNLEDRKLLAEVLKFYYYNTLLSVRRDDLEIKGGFRDSAHEDLFLEFNKSFLYKFNMLLIGQAYLASLSSGSATTDVLLVSNNKDISKSLYAIDFGARTQLGMASLTVVDGENDDGKLQSSPFHNVGITYPIDLTGNPTRAVDFAMVHRSRSTQPQRYYIGGDTCGVCHPPKGVEPRPRDVYRFEVEDEWEALTDEEVQRGAKKEDQYWEKYGYTPSDQRPGQE